MANRMGGRTPSLEPKLKIPEGWEVVKEKGGIITIRPVSEVNAHHVNKMEGVA